MRRASLILAALALLAGPVRADECPADKILTGPSERTLAGFDIRKETIPDLIARLGKPPKSKMVIDLSDFDGPGWVKHKWTRGETGIGVSGHRETIQILQVSNDHGDPGYATGRGLRLGDDRERVVDLYGTTFVEGRVTGPEIGLKTVTYCYDDGIELSVGLDDADYVTAIRVTAPPARRL
jgi:hypothetical protein